jgi:hypothetical protein
MVISSDFFCQTEPAVQFGSDKLKISEPKVPGKSPAKLQVELVRTGDVSSASVVQVFSKDGSAKAGKDYEAVNRGETIQCKKKKIKV